MRFKHTSPGEWSPPSSSPEEAEEKQEVYVAYALSPSEFFLQMKSDEQALKQIQDDLFNQFAQPDDPSWLVDAPVVGSTYAAFHPLYDTWYRAIVKHVKGDMLCVQFIDYGDEADVVVANIRQLLPEHLKTVPTMAIEASIDLGQATVLWPEDICQQFASETFAKPFTADFGPVVNGVQLVRSLVFEGNDLVPVFTTFAFPPEHLREDATEAGNDSSFFSEPLSEFLPTIPVSDTPPRQEVSIEFFDFPKDDSEAQPVQLFVEAAQDLQGNLVGIEADQEEMFIEPADGVLKEPDAGIPQIHVEDELVSSEFASCPQSPAGEEFAAASDYGNSTGAEVNVVPAVVEGVRVLASDEEGNLMEDVPQKSPLDEACEQLDTAVEDVVEADVLFKIVLGPVKDGVQLVKAVVANGADLVPAFAELLRSSTPVPEGFLKSEIQVGDELVSSEFAS